MAPPVWAEGKRRRLRRFVNGSHYDWIVAPVQVQQQEFDRAERSMTAADLSYVLAECGLSIPNTYLLERTLGEGLRKIPLKDIDGLAQAVGGKNIVVPFVGHDDLNNMMLTLAVIESPRHPPRFFRSGLRT